MKIIRTSTLAGTLLLTSLSFAGMHDVLINMDHATTTTPQACHPIFGHDLNQVNLEFDIEAVKSPYDRSGNTLPVLDESQLIHFAKTPVFQRAGLSDFCGFYAENMTVAINNGPNSKDYSLSYLSIQAPNLPFLIGGHRCSMNYSGAINITNAQGNNCQILIHN